MELRKQKSGQLLPEPENKTAPTIRDVSGQFGAGLRYWLASIPRHQVAPQKFYGLLVAIAPEALTSQG